MASTNQTTHYELSQYIGTDKPTYLVDYNQDMNKIDAGIYAAKSESDLNTSAIGTLSNLTTTAKTNLVAAINEVKGETSSIGVLTDLTTTAKTSTVAAINEVNAGVGTIGDLTDLTTTVKTSTVAAINEVVGEVGTLANLTTTAKTNLVAALNEVNANSGDLTNLTTTAKTSLVAAINEVNANSVIDSGSGYIKYSDGTMICYGNVEGTTSQYNNWEAGLVFTNAINFSNFPVAFISTPVVSINMNEVSGGDIAWIMPGFQGNNTSTTNPGSFSLCRPSSFNNFHYDVDYVAIGKWK